MAWQTDGPSKDPDKCLLCRRLQMASASGQDIHIPYSYVRCTFFCIVSMKPLNPDYAGINQTIRIILFQVSTCHKLTVLWMSIDVYLHKPPLAVCHPIKEPHICFLPLSQQHKVHLNKREHSCLPHVH